MINYFQQHSILFLTLVGAFGLMVGSFLNVVIYRLPIMLERDWLQQSLTLETPASINENHLFNLSLPRSHCPHCRHKLSVWENIPLLSFIILRGRCRVCQHNISWLYPTVELLTAVCSILVAIHFGVSILMLAGLIFVWLLISVTFIDLETLLVPDVLTLPFLWLGLLASLFNLFTNSRDAIIGAVAGYSVLWLINRTYQHITKNPGMGHGDFKLLAGLGAWLGWQLLPFILFIASALGSIVGIGLIICKNYSRRTMIPFGPFLALSGLLTLLWGEKLLQWYLNIAM